MSSILPPSVALLQLIANHMPVTEVLLNKSSSEFKQFKEFIQTHDIISDSDKFLNSSLYITHTQLMMLVGMSMFGGILTPIINTFDVVENTVSLTWDTGISDTFTIGVYDDQFSQFSTFYQDRLSSKPQHNKHIPASIFPGIHQFILSYITVLKAVNTRLTLLLGDKRELLNLFTTDIPKNLLFILMSCLPIDILNAMFIHIQQYFPKDLTAKTPAGQTVLISSLFEKPSSNYTFLNEKILVYMDFYFNKDMPIIREITQSKTTDYIETILKNDNSFKSIHNHILDLKRYQLDVRLDLYNIYNNMFDALLN